jgi:hypothetical protein
LGLFNKKEKIKCGKFKVIPDKLKVFSESGILEKSVVNPAPRRPHVS